METGVAAPGVGVGDFSVRGVEWRETDLALGCVAFLDTVGAIAMRIWRRCST